MSPFHQVYDPVAGSVALSATAAALPLVVLAILLAVLRVAPWRSAIIGAATAFALAILVWAASMLAGLGFEPILAAVLSLVANTAPVAFGSIGIPVTTLGGLVAPILERDVQSTTQALSAMVGRQLPFFSVLIPAYLVVLLAYELGGLADG